MSRSGQPKNTKSFVKLTICLSGHLSHVQKTFSKSSPKFQKSVQIPLTRIPSGKSYNQHIIGWGYLILLWWIKFQLNQLITVWSHLSGEFCPVFRSPRPKFFLPNIGKTNISFVEVPFSGPTSKISRKATSPNKSLKSCKISVVQTSSKDSRSFLSSCLTHSQSKVGQILSVIIVFKF